VIAAVAMLFAASPALALSKHTFSSSFGGSGATALSNPSGVAVDQASGDVYVTDPANHRIEKFSSSGEFILMFGKDVDKSTGADICAAASGDECQSGTGTTDPEATRGAFADPRFVAVDNSGGLSGGDVYVASEGVLAEGGENEVYLYKFDSSGHLITSWRRGGQLRLDSFGIFSLSAPITINHSGDLFVSGLELGQFGAVMPGLGFSPLAIGPGGNFFAQTNEKQVDEFSSTGADLGRLTGPGFSGPLTGIASDPSADQLYLADAGASIRHYDAACEPSFGLCTPTDSFGPPELGETTGLAIEESSGVLYAADAANHRVDVFSPTPFLPDPSISSPAASSTPTSVTLDGDVNPANAGQVSACHFQYLSDAALKADETNEVQTLTLSGATGGEFTLSFEGQSTGATGSGELISGFPQEFESVTTTAGSFVPGEAISGEGIPPGTVIAFTFANYIGISNPATSVGRVALRANLTYDPTAETLGNALAALPTIGSGNVEVSGPEGGPYAIEFKGSLARTDLPQLGTNSSALTPPSATASVETTTEGGDGWAKATAAPCLNEANEEVDTHPIPNSAASASVHAGLASLSTETTYHYRLLAANANGSVLSRAHTFTPHAVIGLGTESPTDVSGEAATLNASLLGDGSHTQYFFEWGTTEAYGHTSAEEDAGSPSGPNPTHLSATLTGLSPLTLYHYRIVAENGSHEKSDGEDQSFTTPPLAPLVRAEAATEVRSETTLIRAQVNPGAGDTVYHVEYGSEDCAGEPSTPCTITPMLEGHAGDGTAFVDASVPLQGLKPGTTYHYRIIAENGSDTGRGPDRTFTTFPQIPLINDPCPNAHVRQQTGAAGLLDCRAYELVSAQNANGYDVESDLVPGQTPFADYPQAEGRVLYGVHDGGIPGTDHPTNRGLDPYVARRGAEGWSTVYVGVPANDPFAAEPFSSVPTAASSSLETLAFGAPGGCSPCFENGYTGIPVRLSGGELVQGMVASSGVSVPGPEAKPDGYIAKDLSANGEHFIFGSTSRFARGGDDDSGDVSIYDRNLKSGETHVVSNTPKEGEDGPEPLPCLQGAGQCSAAGKDSNGIAELDISADGSHVLLGQKVETLDGNTYWHLYMDINDSIRSVDLTPGTTHGVLFDGMTEDGSRVFFTTADALHTATNQDTDESVDIYMWSQKGEEEGKPLTRISTGTEGTGNTDSCNPAANSAHEHWNTSGSEANCGVVAVGGGGGVASGDGTIYFLSPEKLAGSQNGVQNAPNLYVARPSEAYSPRYVTTLESVLTGPQPPRLRHTFDHKFGSFSNATALAVEHSSGDVYVLDAEANTIEKFDSSGDPVDFTQGSGAGTNQLIGSETPAGSFGEYPPYGLPTQLAVDQSSGDLYVPDVFGGVIDVFASSGKYLSQIGGLSLPTGVAVDPATGHVYVSTFSPGSIQVFDSSGNPLFQFPTLSEAPASSVAVGPGGTVYVAQLLGPTNVYDSSGAFLRTLDHNRSRSVAVDPSNGDVYVDEAEQGFEGEQITRFDSSGNRIETLRPEGFSGSSGVAIEPEGNLYATEGGGTAVAVFPASLAPSPLIDNPLVIDAVGEPETRQTADFQVTPTGNDAVFPATLALAGGEEETAGHSEIYRYDAPSERMTCVSCDPTDEPATSDASLAGNGLSLTDDGRVFFATADSLAASDTDNRSDVYQWEPRGAGNCEESSPSFSKATGACLALISAGTSTFDSGLLGVTANGKDAYFFTRDSLVPQDKNGPTMKIYDAREGGGFPFTYPPAECKASDECHGASSTAPGPPAVGSTVANPGNVVEKQKCSRGRVLKHGPCPRRHHKPKHGKRAAHHRRGKSK
jgi:DNA-binding beta-propeller fold protein YncE